MEVGEALARTIAELRFVRLVDSKRLTAVLVCSDDHTVTYVSPRIVLTANVSLSS